MEIMKLILDNLLASTVVFIIIVTGIIEIIKALKKK